MARTALVRSAVVAAISTMVAVAWAGPAAATPDEWLQVGHDGGATYANLGETVLSPKVVAQGLVSTTVDAGLPGVGQPLVRDGSVYTTALSSDGYTDRLRRFDIATRAKVWSEDLLCYGLPTLSGDTILIDDSCGVSQPAPPKAFSTVDGSMRYVAADYFGFVSNGVAYLTSGPADSADGIEVTAMNVATGDVLWQLPGSATGPLGRPLLAAGNTVYVQRGPVIEARDADTGAFRWSRTTTRTVSPLAAVPAALYVRWQDGSRHGIARWRPTTGVADWSMATDGSFAFTPKTIYQTRSTGSLVARDSHSGAVVWSRSGSDWSGLGQPVYADHVIWAMSGSVLNAFDASNGDPIFSEDIAASTVFAVAEGHVFVPSPDGRLFILSPRS
jgi:hypothetical protein